MAGLPGAGKSTIRKEYFGGYHIVDCDEIKKSLPGYDPDHPRALHAESKIVENLVLQDYMKKGVSFVYDTTATNTNKVVKMIQNAQKKGYKVLTVYVEVQLATAIERNSNRHRVVPKEIILDKYMKLGQSLDAIKKFADMFVTINNEDKHEFENISTHGLMSNLYE